MQNYGRLSLPPKRAGILTRGAPSLSPLEITPRLAYTFPTVDSLENFCDGFANMEV